MSFFIALQYGLVFISFCGVITMLASVVILWNVKKPTTNDLWAFAYMFSIGFIIFAVPVKFINLN